MKRSKSVPNSQNQYQGNEFCYLQKRVMENCYLANKILYLGNDIEEEEYIAESMFDFFKVCCI